MEKKLEAFGRILTIMDELRARCPWDRKQTMETLRNLTIEETYELADAILEKDMKTIKEELGDVLLHIIFYSKIAEEQGAFDIADVIHTECDKLVHRHPHIYGDVEVSGEEEVKKNWEKLKLSEGKKSVLEGVPAGLPALVKAYRIQQKAKQVGFEWEDRKQVWDKVEEEVSELKQYAYDGETPDHDRIEDEFGDVLFSLVNYARFLDIDPETALERTNKKFIHRFQYIEKQATARHRTLEDMTLEEMDALWNEAKSH
jgi:XTP/dITP diphosphohydrolase